MVSGGGAKVCGVDARTKGTSVPLQTIITPYGESALEALRGVVVAAKGDDPMAPVTLLLPNNLAGIVARRHLAAGVVDDANGVAAIHLATLSRLAEQLAAPLLAPRRPATSAIVAAAWRAALNATSSILDAVKDHPATIRALLRADRELRDLGNQALDAIAGTSTLVADLVRLHREVTRSLTGGWYDETALLAAATDLVRGDARVATDLGHLVVYLPQELTLAESAFLAALTDGARATALVGITDVERADRVVRRSLDRIGHPLAAEKGKARVGHEVMHASDSDDEVRCVVREVVEALRHHPAHRVAVLYGAAQPYARLLHEHFRAAGITVNGPGTRPVLERSLGRGFLDVLALAEGDLPRAAFFTAVSEAPTRTPDGRRVPTASWERLSRSAAVVRGDDWSTRLAAHIASLEARLTDAAQRDQTYQSQLDRYRRDVESATGLRTFAVGLRERLRQGAALTTWSELSAWASRLFGDLYGDERALAQLPAEEQYAAVTIQSTLRGLVDLDAFDSEAHLQGLVEVVTLALERALPQVGRFGEGLLVAPLSAAIGLEADVVYVVGLAEDSYPGRLSEDALLLERVRDASGGELASYRDRLDGLHRHLLAAFDAAPRVVTSFPRGDLRRSTGRLPSRWLLPTLRDLAGDKSLAATAWETVVSERLRGSPSYASSLTTLALPASEQEWRTRAAGGRHDVADATVDRAQALIRGRTGDAFTRYDGNLAEVVGLPDYADGQRLVSPTALESFAVCPHAYFVERLLRVSPVDQPEELISISPLEIGNLIHETMDAFITECAGSLPGYGEPWTPAHRSRLRAIAIDKAAEFEQRGLTGHARLWETERDRILGDLDYMLDNDATRRKARNARVLRSELSFGRNGAPAVSVQVAGGQVLMRGSADKVDETSDGTLIVVDIKTGSTSRFTAMKTDPIAAGTKLQLPVYAEAARQLLGGDRAEAAYWFVRQGKHDWIEVELDDDLRRRYAAAVGTLVSSIASGLFPGKAPDQPDFRWVQCAFCNPDGLGHGDARSRWERQRHDPTLRELVALIDPGALDDQGEGNA